MITVGSVALPKKQKVSVETKVTGDPNV